MRLKHLVIVVFVAVGLCIPAMAAAGRGAKSTTKHYVMPNLTGMSRVKARAALKAAGHKGTVYEERANCPDNTKRKVRNGQVCYQHPYAGKRQGTRTPVRIVVKGATKSKPKKRR